MTLREGTQLGAYRVVRPLGSGGMGEVYLAEDTRLHREVALKVLPQLVAADRERRDRFEREAQAAARLNHPNIVTIHSIEEADGIPFLTMEYISGKPLADVLPAEGLPLRQLLAYAIPLADAVSAAHQRGIVHRDLKPGNILISDDGRVKVLDFGLAKLKEGGPAQSLLGSLETAPLTGEGKILGTTAYMSPEQAEAQEVDHRSDIFSLGIILYEMATGRRPFQGPSSAAVLSAILRDMPPLVTELKPDLPPELGRIVRRCLAKDRTRRYQTALDLRTELEELKEDSESRPASTLPGAESHARARRRRSAVAAACALAMVAAVAGAYLLLRTPRETVDPSAHSQVVERQITTASLEDPVTAAVISPDGKYIAYADFRGIHIRLIGTGETRTLNAPADMCFT